jgi:hypothetical protein
LAIGVKQTRDAYAKAKVASEEAIDLLENWLIRRKRHGFQAVVQNGPAARSFAADARDCILVRSSPINRVQGYGAISVPDGEGSKEFFCRCSVAKMRGWFIGTATSSASVPSSRAREIAAMLKLIYERGCRSSESRRRPE